MRFFSEMPEHVIVDYDQYLKYFLRFVRIVHRSVCQKIAVLIHILMARKLAILFRCREIIV